MGHHRITGATLWSSEAQGSSQQRATLPHNQHLGEANRSKINKEELPNVYSSQPEYEQEHGGGRIKHQGPIRSQERCKFLLPQTPR
jgi:hypothetical protein